jgi:hypothetical protein
MAGLSSIQFLNNHADSKPAFLKPIPLGGASAVNGEEPGGKTGKYRRLGGHC